MNVVCISINRGGPLCIGGSFNPGLHYICACRFRDTYCRGYFLAYMVACYLNIVHFNLNNEAKRILFFLIESAFKLVISHCLKCLIHLIKSGPPQNVNIMLLS